MPVGILPDLHYLQELPQFAFERQPPQRPKGLSALIPSTQAEMPANMQISLRTKGSHKGDKL